MNLSGHWKAESLVHLYRAFRGYLRAYYPYRHCQRQFLEGYNYAANNPDEAAQILLKYAPELDKNLTLKSQEWISKYYLDDAGCFGVMKASVWEKFTTLLYDLQVIIQNPLMYQLYLQTNFCHARNKG